MIVCVFKGRNTACLALEDFTSCDEGTVCEDQCISGAPTLKNKKWQPIFETDRLRARKMFGKSFLLHMEKKESTRNVLEPECFSYSGLGLGRSRLKRVQSKSH